MPRRNITGTDKLMQCLNCSHLQTFAAHLVGNGLAFGFCDNCHQQSRWQEQIDNFNPVIVDDRIVNGDD